MCYHEAENMTNVTWTDPLSQPEPTFRCNRYCNL